jgi:hypothetical protein
VGRRLALKPKLFPFLSHLPVRGAQGGADSVAQALVQFIAGGNDSLSHQRVDTRCIFVVSAVFATVLVEAARAEERGDDNSA